METHIYMNFNPAKSHKMNLNLENPDNLTFYHYIMTEFRRS